MIPQSTPAQTRRSLVAAVAAEDPDANLLAPPDEAIFQRLVHDHQQRLYRFIVKHIGWGTDAEDLTQQAFVEAANSFATFKGDSELSTWLYRNDPHGEVVVQAQVADGALQVTLADQAPTFDPVHAPEPDTTLSIEERRIGGLGLLFVRRTADTLSWATPDPARPQVGNVVRFSKKLQA